MVPTFRSPALSRRGNRPLQTQAPQRPQTRLEVPAGEQSLERVPPPGHGAGPGTRPTTTRTTVAAYSYSGPLPPPEALLKYQQVFPGCAERIVKMAEEQSAHRQRLESSRMEATNRTERLGQVFGFTISMTAILVGGVLIYVGKNAWGITSILGSLGVLVATFVAGKVTQGRERAEKRRESRRQSEDEKG